MTDTPRTIKWYRHKIWKLKRKVNAWRAKGTLEADDEAEMLERRIKTLEAQRITLRLAYESNKS